ncbi:MAG: hypothetical protein O7E52_24610 [Candidatus Poribacteria bacterium]|nr:hypothetical protein [Candidatus Poribacteria bacterium]
MKVNTTDAYFSRWYAKRLQPPKPEEDGRKFEHIFGDLIAMGYSMKGAIRKARRLAAKG